MFKLGVCFLQVAGARYNAAKGVLKISCDRYRAREDNRRQALHWALRLVEATLVAHPTDAWEDLKRRQRALLDTLDDGSGGSAHGSVDGASAGSAGVPAAAAAAGGGGSGAAAEAGAP